MRLRRCICPLARSAHWLVTRKGVQSSLVVYVHCSARVLKNGKALFFLLPSADRSVQALVREICVAIQRQTGTHARTHACMHQRTIPMHMTMRMYAQMNMRFRAGM